MAVGGESDKGSLILMGRIGAAHGIRGEVRIQSFTEDPMALVDYGPLATSKPGLTVKILSARTTTNVLVARLDGVNDRSAAERLNGVELFVDRTLLPEPEDDDDFYHADLIGLHARLSDGSEIGVVAAVPNFGAGDLLEIRDPRSGDTYLYPFSKAVVPEIRIAEGYLLIEPPIEAEPGDEEPD